MALEIVNRIWLNYLIFLIFSSKEKKIIRKLELIILFSMISIRLLARQVALRP